MTSESSVPSQKSMFTTLGALSIVSFGVIGLVGRSSYKRKVAYLAKQMAEEAKSNVSVNSASSNPPRVWTVLTPSETLKVFFIPMAFVLGGTYSVGVFVKRWFGIRDWDHGIATMKWVARTGPAPS